MARSKGRREGGEHRKERPVETFTTGLVLTIVFGTLIGVLHGAWWMVFPLAFMGVAPMVRGLVGMVGGRSRALRGSEDRPLLESGATPASRSQAEKEILGAAEAGDGVVTPALVALKTSLSIDEADQMLQDLARRGHASMIVAEDGHVEYHFQEFRPRLPPGRPGEP
jgi:hypothetical protein